MRLIPLTHGYEAMVSDCDFEWLSAFKWFAVKNPNGNVYAMRRIKKGLPHMPMHRQILELVDPKILGEHADGNGLNNQRDNLRPANKSQNAMNNKRYITSKTGFKGVSWSEKIKKYRAYIVKDYKQKALGTSECPETCARTYNKAAREMFKEFALLNDVKDGPLCEAVIVFRNNTTGFRGVLKSGKCFVAHMGVGKQKAYLGTYATAEEAAFKYNVEAKKLLSDKAKLNDLSKIDTSKFTPDNPVVKTKPTEFNGVAVGKKGYRAIIYLNGKQVHLGGFTDPEEAAHAYDAKAIELYGPDYKKLNFPAQPTP